LLLNDIESGGTGEDRDDFAVLEVALEVLDEDATVTALGDLVFTDLEELVHSRLLVALLQQAQVEHPQGSVVQH